eukprot:TRINITY_DN4874_c0_g1_i1.p1 TRINITY_DN4874_c0_g1~~TRINITY_DN4874_c0_g1_i1.p1  ORF type:complete len:387 (-),score=87.78 TRINITY_DN4874_c0_g1_i1:140-1300(-)
METVNMEDQKTTDLMIESRKKAENEWEEYKKKIEETNKKSKKAKFFYKQQNEILDFILDYNKRYKIGEEHNPLVGGEVQPENNEKDDEEKRSWIFRWGAKGGVYLSFLVNVCLLVAKSIVAFASGSTAILASALDSFLDLVSGGIFVLTTRYMQKPQPELYPIGKSRMEPLGVIVFSTLMLGLSLMIILQSIQDAVKGPDVKLSMMDIIVVCIVIGLKAFLFLYCRAVPSPQTRALAQDHFNDVLSNSFGLGAAVGAVYYQQLMDPIGAICISLYIIFVWMRTLMKHLKMLAGKSAPTEFLTMITYMAATHKGILLVDRVSAWHLGLRYLVEVDVVLPENSTLKEAHDLGESLQIIIEHHPDVERAFVHLDYETCHRVDDEHKIKI